MIAEFGPRSKGVVLRAKLAGDYLRIADHRVTAHGGGHFGGEFFPKPIRKANPITSVSIVGRIAVAGDG